VLQLFSVSFPTSGEITSGQGSNCNDCVLKASLATRYAVRFSEALESQSHSEISTKSTACPSDTASKILLHSQLLFRQESESFSSGDSLGGNPSRALVRSILLCGSEGAGKSHLLHWLVAEMRATVNRNTSPALTAVYASAQNINKLSAGRALQSVASLLQRDDPQDGLSSGTLSVRSAGAYLSVLLEVLEVESALRVAAVGALLRGECLLVVLDSLDTVLRQYGVGSEEGAVGEENSFEGAAVLDPGNEFQIVGHLVTKLLQFLAPACTGGESGCAAMVVGACRLDLKAVPRAHTGCPEFELRVLLPRLSASDRADVVLYMLSSHLRHQPVQLEADLSGEEGVDVVGHWASRIASITAGYLPGDLLALVRHTFLIHRGVSEAEASNGGVQMVLRWETLLQALLALPPKQLQSLGIDSSSGGGGPSQQSRLSWSDFAGYQHETRQIKRLFSNPRRAEVKSEVAVAASGPTLAELFSCPKGIVLHGPTGCGKSLLARVIAAEVSI
jgi:tRNA A37 threonylcarbamoyladenosine biosynthesis protein TsaE